MSELTISQLEKYILAEDKAKALNEVTPYTASYYFLEIMNEFNTPLKAPEELDQLVANFLKNSHIPYEKAQLVKFKHRLSKINASKDRPEELKKWLEKFNQEFLNVSFDFPNYSRGNIATGLSSTNKVDVKSKFSDEELKNFSLESLLNQLYKEKKIETLNELDPTFFNRIDLARFNLPDDVQVIEAVLREIPDILVIPNLESLLKKHKRLYPSKSFITDFIWPRLDNATKELLLEMDDFKLNQNLLIYYIMEKFDVESLENTETPLEERIEGWKKLLTYLENLPDKYFKYRSLILLKILDLNAQLNNYDEDLLLAYFKMGVDRPKEISRKEVARKQKYNSSNNYNDMIGISTNVNEENLIDDYLKKILGNTNRFKDYINYFDEKTLWKITCTAKLVSGQQVENVDSIYSPRELQDLHVSKKLELVNNPKRFESDQRVAMKLLMKNITQLNVRVFEVNTLNYLLEKNNDNYDTIDITGLIPSEEYTYQYSYLSMLETTQEFFFPSIDKVNKGVFIVDFIGNELNSRAVIHKGSLTVVNDSQTGRNCVIIDKSGKICSGKETGFFIGNTFFACDEASGVISIPLNIASLSQKVVATHEGFAALSLLTLKDPQPSLSINVLYNGESFITGNQVDFLIQSKLFMNGQPISVSKLSNVTVKITILSSEGLQKQNTFKDLKLRDTEDQLIGFMFPKKVKNITVELSAEIKIGANIQNLTASQVLTVEDTRDSVIERYFFRKNEKNELFIQVLGRNGEPITNIPVSLTVSLNFKRRTSNIELISDHNGIIQIGFIEHLKEIIAKGSFGSVSYSEPKKASSLYSPCINTVVGEIIELPLYNAHEKIDLIEASNTGSVKSQLTASNTKIVNGKLIISGLLSGSYHLTIGRQKIGVKIFKGEYFNLNGQNIRTSKSIIRLPKTSQHLLSNTKKDQSDKLFVEVQGDSTNLRAHLLTYNYLPQERSFMEAQIERLNKNQGDSNRSSSFSIEEKLNIYKSGKRLNDEIIYVYDRQTKPSFMGNTLEKPGMLVKRSKIGQTTETAPVINEGDDYGDDQHLFGKNPKRQEMMRCKDLASVRGGGLLSVSNNHIRTTAFLSNPGKIYPNLKINGNRVMLPDEAQSKYSYSMLVLTDGNIASLVELATSNQDIPRIDCRLSESKKPGFIIQYERNLTGVEQGTSIVVKNIKNTEICVIDDLRNLFETLQLLSESDSETLQEWSFLKNWNNIEPMNKLRKYDKYASHELNLFLYCKDREFFDSVVIEFIRNKKEKELVDWYLLGEQRMIDTFCTFSSFQLLNKLELSLLAEASRNSNPVFSSAILKYLKSASALQKVSEKRMTTIFDTLLSSRGEKVNHEDNNAIPETIQLENATYLVMSPKLCAMNENSQAMDRNNRQRNHRRISSEESSEEDLNYNQEECEDEDEDDEESRRSNKNYQLDDCNFVENKEIFTPSQGTIEYKERQFWQRDLNDEVQAFWSELAEHLTIKGSSKGFLSQSFIYDARTFSDCIAMLTFIDLSFDKIKFDSKMQDNNLTIVAPNNLLLLSKEIIEKEGELFDVNVLCAQRFFDPQDRFVYDDEDPTLRVDKNVDEFIVNKVYGSRVVVTNCTSSDLSLNVTHEVPQGAMPIGSADFLKVNKHILSSLQSQVFEFSFYFPSAGSFSIYPATVAKGSRIIASAHVDPTITVKTHKTIKNLETINDILSMGNTEDIIDFIKSKNILNQKIFQFKSIYWLLKNKDFYINLIAVLRAKGLYEDIVWSFGLYHGDLTTWKEFLHCKTQKGGFEFVKYINDTHVNIDRFEIREFYPLINQRAHSLGLEKVNIFNDSFKATYLNFLNFLVQKGSPTSEDWLLLSNYLMAQDRFEEAIAVFGKVGTDSESKINTKIQRDYLLAYIDFVSGYPNFTVAKRICEEYLVYPVLSWRNLFIEMANQLAEFEESALIETDHENQNAKNTNTDKALKTPTFTAEMEGDRIKIISQNVGNLRIEYFKIEIEVLFSLNSFSMDKGNSFSHVKPFDQEFLTLKSGEDYLVYYHTIPTNLSKENLFIQLTINEKGISKSQFLRYMPFNLHCQLNQDFGIVKLIDPATKKPVPKIYVKCFVKYTNGTIAFYKDGYTDLRGSFDYVSLNKDEVNDVEKFSLIVADQQQGFKTLEVQPPKKIGRIEGEAKQLVSKNWSNLQQKTVARPGLSKYAKLI